MARPVPRRRAERDAPAADEYAPRGRRAAVEPEEEPAEERRPRRGRARGELPQPSGRSRRAAAEPEDEPTPSRRRRSAPEPESEPPGPELPTSKRALARLDDAQWADLCIELGLSEDTPEDEVWEAVEEAREEHKLDDDDAGRTTGRRRRPAAEEPSARGRRRAARDDDEENEDDDGPRRLARRGFKGFKKTREESGGFADDFKLSEDEVLVKFLPTLADADHVKEGLADAEGDLLPAEPFATYGEHGLYKELSEGQRVWPCLAPEEDCPVCDTGHKARPVALWNVVVMSESGRPQLKILKAGPKLENLLEKKSALKTGPLDKEYYSLSQTEPKGSGPVEYAVELVRTRDLGDEDGWDVDPLTEDDIDAFLDKAYGPDFVKFPSQKDMKAVARKLRDRD